MKSIVSFVLALGVFGCGLMLFLDMVNDINHYADMSMYRHGFGGFLLAVLLVQAFWPRKNG